jgi:hypothetical protein
MYASHDPAQLVVLAFPSTGSFDRALEDLRDLRLRACVHLEAVGQLTPEDNNESACTIDIWDVDSLTGALLAVLADVLVGKAAVDPVRHTVSALGSAPAARAPVKRIDRGISRVGRQHIHDILMPDSAAIVVLARKSDSAELARAIHATPSLADARRLWVDLHTDLELLVTDVLGAQVTVRHVPLSAALLNAQNTEPPTVLDAL